MFRTSQMLYIKYEVIPSKQFSKYSIDLFYNNLIEVYKQLRVKLIYLLDKSLFGTTLSKLGIEYFIIIPLWFLL